MCVAYWCSAMDFQKSDWQCVIHSGKIPDNWLCYHISGFCFSSKLEPSEAHIHENSGKKPIRTKRLIASWRKR